MKNLKKFTALFCSFLLVCLFVTSGITENASAAAKLKATSLNLTVNQTSKIVINGKSKLATYTFKSSDTKVATVNKSGSVKGVKAGTATITVNSTINKKVSKVGSVKVTVKAVVAPTAAPTVTPMPTPTIVPVEVPKDPITGEIDYSKAMLVALTFDDGPNLITSPKVLDKLEQYNVVASFFLIGSNISDATKPIMERQLKLGCELCNHSWTHSNMGVFDATKDKKEIEDTNKKIFDMVGVTPKFFRAPYLSVSETMKKAITLPFIQGILGSDWEANRTAQQRTDLILSQVQDGNIILLHDFTGNDKTVEALDTIIPELQRRGYVFVTVSQLFEYKGVDPSKVNTPWTLVK